MRKFVMLLLGIFALCTQILAQNRTITGRVTDEKGSALSNASITVKGTSLGTTTNNEGSFTLTVPSTARALVVSYVGLADREVSLTNNTSYEISMTSGGATNMDEVVVVAYGTQRREAMTGAVTTIGEKQLESRVVSNLTQVLAGAVPGVAATSGSGQPGNSAAVRVRGIGSINHGSSPLYVVDGFPYDGYISDINPDDVESITVLKDASSTALYGARAANGAILITTKKGKSTVPKTTISVIRGYSQRGIPEYDLVGTMDYYPIMWRALRNSLRYPNSGTGLSDAAASAQASATIGNELRYNPFNIPAASLVQADGTLNPSAQLRYNDFDWISPLVQNGPRTEANLSTSAKVNRSDYFISANYLKDEGFLIKSDFERASARVVLNTQMKEWLRTGINLSGIMVKSNRAATGSNSFVNPFNFARGIGPIYPVRAYDNNGQPVLDANGIHVYDFGVHTGAVNRPSGGSPGRHVIYETQLNQIIQRRNTMLARGFIEATFLRDFTFTNNIQMDLNNYKTETFRNKIVGDGVGQGGYAGRESDEYRTSSLQQLLNYKKSFGNHEITALLGHENTWRDEVYFSGSRTGANLDGNVELVNFTTLNGATSSRDALRREGYFSRFMYNLDRKYFLELSYRRDGSSRFSPDSRWGNFYSIGASWNAKREAFLDNIVWLNDLKLRASYGTVGNDDVLDGNQNSVYYAYPSIFELGWNNAQEPGALALRLPTPELTWEVNQTINIGVDFGLFKNRISGTLELFDRGSSRLLFNVPQGQSGLVTTRNENVGEMRNRGVELQLNGGILRTQKFSWDIQVNATHIKNEIKKLPNGQPIVSGTKRYEEGYDVNQFWLRQWYGVDPNDGAGLFYANSGLTTGYRVTGKGDTVVTNPTNARFDRSGSALPDLFGGVNSTFQYRGIGVSFQLNYSLGGKFYDAVYAGLMTPSYGGSLHRDALNAWKAPGDASEIPRLDIAQSANFNSQSNRFLIDASYLSVRNVNVFYELNRNLIKKLPISAARFSIIGENLAMFSKRRGMNPTEGASDGTNTNTGVNSNVYTPNRVISAGVSVTF